MGPLGLRSTRTPSTRTSTTSLPLTLALWVGTAGPEKRNVPRNVLPHPMPAGMSVATCRARASRDTLAEPSRAAAAAHPTGLGGQCGPAPPLCPARPRVCSRRESRWTSGSPAAASSWGCSSGPCASIPVQLRPVKGCRNPTASGPACDLISSPSEPHKSSFISPFYRWGKRTLSCIRSRGRPHPGSRGRIPASWAATWASYPVADPSPPGIRVQLPGWALQSLPVSSRVWRGAPGWRVGGRGGCHSWGTRGDRGL